MVDRRPPRVSRSPTVSSSPSAVLSSGTSFPTVGTEARTRRAFHAEAGYRFSSLPVPVGVAYRYAYYDPWAGASATAGGLDPEAFVLQYHTVGVTVERAVDEDVGDRLVLQQRQVLVQLVY